MNLKEAFKNYLDDQSLPLTSEREKIISLIESSKRHFTVDELLLYSVQNELNISRATLYRTVQILMEAGLLIKIQRKNKPPVYESLHNKDPHYHLLCTECGKIIEFSHEEIDRISIKESLDNEFEIGFITLKIYGLCSDCQRRQI